MPRSGPRDASRGFSRSTNLRRRQSVLEERWTMLILTNGERSERDYLNGLKLQHGRSLGMVTVLFDNKAPDALVAQAAKLRRENFYNDAWIVCDVDEFEIDGAAAISQRQNVAIAWSNPCFEVWLIIHFREGCSPLQNGRDAEVKLKQLLPGYDKSNLNFDHFKPNVRVAVERSMRLGDAPTDNPSTSVGALVKFLLDRADADSPEAASGNGEANGAER